MANETKQPEFFYIKVPVDKRWQCHSLAFFSQIRQQINVYGAAATTIEIKSIVINEPI